MRLLVALLLRALGATLLLGAVVLPVADHHAAGRLAEEAGAPPEDAHYLIVHHHPGTRPASPPFVPNLLVGQLATNAPPRTATTVLPAAPPLAVVASGAGPLIDALALGLVLTAVASLLSPGEARRPPSRTRRVPVPPPRPALLSVA